MKKLSEREIIRLMKGRKFHSEDIEIFKLGNEKCAVSVDTLVESTDIPRGSKLSDIARKSIVSTLSDFAAKGIIPKFCIVSLTLPSSISKKQVEELSRGILNACKEFRIQFLGGDTNQGSEISIHVVAFGNVKKIIKRSGSKIGDIICTTGTFGYTASALELLLKKKKSSKEFSTKSKRLFFRPKPRLEFASSSINYITSSMDSSDGLSSCLTEMARQSKKKFLISKLPTNDDIREFSMRNRIDLKKLVLDGGEEFELVFTVAPNNFMKILNLAKKFKIRIHEIGVVENGKGVVFKNKNKSFVIRDKGWDHFR